MSEPKKTVPPHARNKNSAQSGGSGAGSGQPNNPDSNSNETTSSPSPGPAPSGSGSNTTNTMPATWSAVVATGRQPTQRATLGAGTNPTAPSFQPAAAGPFAAADGAQPTSSSTTTSNNTPSVSHSALQPSATVFTPTAQTTSSTQATPATTATYDPNETINLSMASQSNPRITQVHSGVERITNKGAAKDEVDALSLRLIEAQNTLDHERGHPTPAGGWKEQDMVKKHGLRTSFAPADEGEWIDTNFLSMGYPGKIEVYQLELIRGFNTANGSQINVKKRADKLLVLEELATNQLSTHLQPRLPYWVSDGDLIWSTMPLFHQNDPLVVPPPVQTIPYRNEMGDLLTIHRATITHHTTLDLNQSTSRLFFDATAPTFNSSTPGILTRGLNLFFTKHVRQREGNAPGQTTTVGANKSFRNQQGDDLDRAQHGQIRYLRAISGFFLSIRPGVQEMFINMSIATSPFFQNMTVSDFIAEAQGDNRSHGEIANILKGIKVEIMPTWSPNNDGQTFPHGSSRTRFICWTNMSSLQAQQSNWTHWPNAGNLAQLYGVNNFGPSPYPADPFLPNPATVAAFDGTEIAINVGKDQPPRPQPGQQNAPRDQSEWYPASCLRIVQWQQFKGHLTGDQTTRMIQVALRNPNNHKARLLGPAPPNNPSGTQHFGFVGSAQQGGLTTMNMSAGTQFIRIPARWLDAPAIQYARAPSYFSVDAAQWNLKGVSFRTLPKPENKMKKLPLINLSGGGITGGEMAALRSNFTPAFNRHGLVSANTPWEVENPLATEIPHGSYLEQVNENKVRDFFNRVRPKYPKCTIFLVVLPRKEFNSYAAIKRVAELRLGMKVVCLTKQKMTSRGSLPSNVALKYNIKSECDPHHLQHPSLAKLRGSNNNTIVIGADVTHPGNGTHPGTPSIAAVVGTTDDNFMRYPGSMRLQRNKKEDIVDLAEMVKERLMDWATEHNTRDTPDNILFYRDGVSESQYDIIRRRELPQIQLGVNRAYRLLNANDPAARIVPENGPNGGSAATPLKHAKGVKSEERMQKDKENEENFAADVEAHKDNHPFRLTFVVVGKHHNTRFYSTQPTQHTVTNQNTNPKPGLAVDQVITHPYNMDFYLQSHKALQGTGRPAHYYVLRNNIELTIDDLQKITHTFCYAYARATMGVSYCAPAYYADRLCDRGRLYLRHLLLSNYQVPPNPAWDPRGTRTWEQFCDDQVTRYSLHSNFWNAYNPNPGTKYASRRMNPWHPDLDKTMFYL